MTQTIAPTRPARRIKYLHILTRQLPLFSPPNERTPAKPTDLPVLSGNYEVCIPGRGGRLAFAETLAEAARLVADALDGSDKEYERTLYLLEAEARRGGLKPYQRGMFLRQVYQDKVLFIDVQGRQRRPAPAFCLNDLVCIDTLEGEVPTGRAGRIHSVHVIDRTAVGRQYLYVVGSHQLPENRLTKAPSDTQ